MKKSIFMYRYSSFNVEFYSFVVSICRRKKEYLYRCYISIYTEYCILWTRGVHIHHLLYKGEKKAYLISD